MTRFILPALLVLAFASGSQAAEPMISPKKTIQVTVDERGLIYIGRDTLNTLELTEEIHIRLWKSYLGTSKMYSLILVKYTGNARTANQAPVEKALKEAQQKTLQEVSVHKYKKKFEELNATRQGKLRKQFPVLFQQLFTE